MDNNITKKQNAFISEEEKTLNWEDIQATFKKVFGTEVYNSWLQKISLVKEYNDYLILGVPKSITSQAHFTDKGVDEQTSIIFNYKNNAQAVLKMTLKNNTPCKAIISGEKGYLEISGPFYAPASMILILNNGTKTFFDNNYEGQGLREQAYEFAKCKNLELIESPLMPHKETLEIMESMDLIRQQIGLKYPND